MFLVQIEEKTSFHTMGTMYSKNWQISRKRSPTSPKMARSGSGIVRWGDLFSGAAKRLQMRFVDFDAVSVLVV